MNRIHDVLADCLTGAVILSIRCYRASAFLFRAMSVVPCACRFVPSCSENMEGSIRRLGLIRGVTAGIAQLARCHPFYGFGGASESQAERS